MPTTQFDETIPATGAVTFAAADGTALKTLYDNRPFESRLDHLWAVNGDDIPHTLVLTFVGSGGQARTGSVTLAAGAGLNGTPAIDVLAACLPPDQQGLVFDVAAYLAGSLTVAVTGANSVDLTTQGANL